MKMKDEYNKFCMNCEHWLKGNCNITNTFCLGNIVTNCTDFKGGLKFVQWSKSRTIGYRPSTFSKSHSLQKSKK